MCISVYIEQIKYIIAVLDRAMYQRNWGKVGKC